MGSPREESEDGGPRDLKEGTSQAREYQIERGWLGRNIHIRHPFPKSQVWKGLSLRWARVLIKLMRVITSGPHTVD